MALDHLRLDQANLVGLIMQSFFYGIFQVLFFTCMYVLTIGRNTDRVNYPFLCTAILMWILIGVNFALSWSRIMDAFIGLQPELAKDPEALIKYFGNLANWKEVSRTGVYVGLTAVADSLFIYRCYVVWGHNKYVVILPLLLLCASITSGIGIEVVIGTAGSTTALFATNLAVWATSFFSISLVQNVLTTFLIVFRIWMVNRGIRALSPRNSLLSVVSVVLESGAIYSSTLFVLLMTYVSNSFVQYVALDMLVPIIGIVFNLIIVRVGLGLTSNRNQVSTNGGVSTTGLVPGGRGGYPLQSLKRVDINVSQQVTVDRDRDLEAKAGYSASELEEPSHLNMDGRWKARAM